MAQTVSPGADFNLSIHFSLKEPAPMFFNFFKIIAILVPVELSNFSDYSSEISLSNSFAFGRNLENFDDFISLTVNK